eukprot:NODE_1218_length_1030_cov_666.672783_g934_i0.p2 GENE.NODE_1218_length_1030_cov_666.672783_g934_i0~~NODE_1218_length_1030_cov_666.672783_g934_i0.p2  ORF type:complete len:188 (+),score=59.96 NODE_1218_length_1030_cov_666.672783_g934_i0:380-943(+)
MKRLKIPPALHQFQCPASRHTRGQLLKFAAKYRPEDKLEKKRRLRSSAEAKLKDPTAAAIKKKQAISYGIQLVTRLVERKAAKLVLIAFDVEPVEIVLFLPALCRKMEVPYAIVKDKSLLGKLVGLKTTSCIAFTGVKPADQPAFDKLLECVSATFNDRFEEIKKKWGGMRLSTKSKQRLAKKKKAK